MDQSQLEPTAFNPERKSISQDEAKRLTEVSKAFPGAYADTILAEVRAKKGSYDARKRAILQGQRAGKLWLKLIEGVPPQKQLEMIGLLDRRVSQVHDKLGIPKNGFLAGAKGEFATGVMLVRSGLEVKYPPEQDDLYNKTDLMAFLSDGRKMRVQSKALKLPQSAGRQISKDPVPIFSMLRSDEDFARFRDAVVSIPSTDESAFERISEIVQDAKIFRQMALDKGDIPIYCLLDASESETSDIISATARPNKEAENQGLSELDQIIKMA
ncbi:MAG: hypothetical protein HW405_238 [Candidatus Berkelbacteria bacterium]|nr:hypothetical protein [Candidatus Berkelbacteria bacterium]